MKSPAGHARPRRSTPKKQVRLDLRRSSLPPAPEDGIGKRRQKSFWKWFVVVALFHFFLFAIVMWIYRPSITPPPPQFISLVPLGETVHGTPGPQAAPKVGASTPAPSVHHQVVPPTPAPPEPAAPPPPPQAVRLPPQKPAIQPLIHDDTASVVQSKPAPTKPAPPKPKVKVDLHLADGPTPEHEKTRPKLKHLKKTAPPVSQEHRDLPDRNASNPDSLGLSKEQIAQRLGEKLETAGIKDALKTGVTGAEDGHDNPFADFYASIHDQVMNKWQEPNLDDAQATNPVVQIHVEPDGRVPAERVILLTSSGNPAIDDSALGAARSLGYTLQPLPDGCPPDISITFKLTH